jgi:riboflavin-specific deaminase-like protein
VKKKTNIKKSKLPFVFSNFAITADGKIAFANGEFDPFGSERDREHMMELRATADAVMVGARTVETPGVTLGPGGKKFQRLRLARGLAEYSLRVIVSGSGSMDTRAEIFKHRFSPIIVLTSQMASKKGLRLQGIADEVKVFGEREIDLPAALHWLREKWNVKRLLCEGGGGLHGSLVRAGLMDELHLTICPVLFGGRSAPTIGEGGNVLKLADAVQFRFTSAKRFGDELFVVLKASKKRQR